MIALVGVACDNQPAAPATKQETYTGVYGEEFCYTLPLAVEYNVLAERNSTALHWGKRQIGELIYTGLPPEVPDDDFIDVVKKDIEERYGANNVTHEELRNGAGHRFQTFRAAVQDRDGHSHEYRLYLFFDWRKPGDFVGESPPGHFVGYRFELVVPLREFQTIKPHIEEVISTFKPPAGQAVRTQDDILLGFSSEPRASIDAADGQCAAALQFRAYPKSLWLSKPNAKGVPSHSEGLSRLRDYPGMMWQPQPSPTGLRPSTAGHAGRNALGVGCRACKPPG